MGSFTIGEVAREVGVNATVIRFWERAGVLSPPPRVNGRRRYDEAALARLSVVQAAQEVGFSIADIRALVEGFDDEGVSTERWHALAERKIDELDELITRAGHMKQVLEDSLHCGCLTLDSCEMVLHRPRPESSEALAKLSRPLRFR